MGELFQQTTFEDYDERLDELEARNPRTMSPTPREILYRRSLLQGCGADVRRCNLKMGLGS